VIINKSLILFTTHMTKSESKQIKVFCVKNFVYFTFAGAVTAFLYDKKNVVSVLGRTQSKNMWLKKKNT